MSEAMQTVYQRLNVCRLASNLKVVKEAAKQIAPDKRNSTSHREKRKEFYRRIMICHAEAAICYLSQFKR